MVSQARIAQVIAFVEELQAIAVAIKGIAKNPWRVVG
jgi:hypothetical protein